ncbi:MAG TPA: UDP-N-acetylglucosamine--N-acetylmuramyl-(pentapeptide) pyrophosphoryl-undecaprenol N-acetylglucosamine transferase [Tepidisphaeraceae bacterium]|jgi:UDP-N-acetylglucosamine--N-acetylmuramyl-(pentapeptide) pyrophosphoryl-undecaprenol N-acetylglucosamine transferase|nr:UDP-N-acetylglucosamine--N-acetylmuramyl-(pentapeptide) pyrophosphoryl-undecaprenol N-acetylglucosamine transferase [Tepidisphaeraceae bacterium]
MPDSPTILFAGGGTGGHLYPGISVAQALLKVNPNIRPLFLTTNKEIDKVILEPTGFEFIPQPIVPPVKTVGGLLKFWKSWRDTKDIVRKTINDRRPAAVLGLGGYAAGVAVKEGAQRGLKAAVINPDVIPGKANQYLLQYVDTVCCQFAETAEHVEPKHHGKLRVTGCPIRTEILAMPSRDEAIARLGLERRLSTLVVTGASLGAKTVNEAILTMLKDVTLRGWQILHLSGREHVDSVRAGYRELEQPARILDFTPAMADVWAVADIAISRSGASSCAELTACGVPSILLPYPYHKDMHQRANAKVLADAGAAILIDDDKDRRKNADKLRPALESLLFDGNKRKAMSDAARRIGKPNASDEVAAAMLAMIG